MPAIDRFLKFIESQGASDLHIAAKRRPVIRLDGTIVSLKGDVLKPDETERLFREIMPAHNQEELDQRGDTDFAYELEDVARFRVNVFEDMYGVGGACRLIPNRIRSVDELGIPGSVTKLCYLPKGLVLVTGPTGCGKSTTLASLVQLINETRKAHIVTIEDPIEYVYEESKCRINQREVHTHAESFPRALRAALRQDPDVVLVGEMRDLETTRTAIQTAETGHVVFATLHTTTAASSVDRLISQYPPSEQEQIRSMVASNLTGVVSQTLLRRRNGGMVAAFEVLIVTAAVQATIRERKLHQIPSIMQTSAKAGMVQLNDSLVRLVVQDMVEPREAFASTVDREELERKLKMAGVEVAPEEAMGLEE
ncbi:MAG: PilT/PilU family type 4a pilus ATPase [Candidatus Brocadiia bacterium]